MKNFKTVITMMLAVVGSSSIIISCVARKSEPVKSKNFNPASERIANGERVYMMHCHKCHPGGEAGIGPAINSNPAPQFIKRFQSRHGLGVMPPFKRNEISTTDLRDVSKYMKAWKKY